MFCPYCGVSNERWEAKCFVCERSLPSLDVMGKQAAAAATPSGRARPGRRAVADSSQPAIASVGDRAIALIFDRVIIAAILMAAGALGADVWTSFKFQSPLWNILALAGAVFAVMFLYHFISEVAVLTTVGKAAMGLHVGVEEGRNRFGAIAIRNALRIIDGIGLYLVGFFFATFTSRRQRVGDLVGGTVVVEWPIPRGGRAAVMVLMVIIVAAAIWIAWSICPTCARQMPSIR